MSRKTLTDLSKESGKSISTLRRLFKNFLSKQPTSKIKLNNDCHLIVDATYFGKEFCLMNYYDNDYKYLQLSRIIERENFADIVVDLEFLKQKLKIVSITSDGHKSLIKAVKYVFPEVINQRCVIHIQRMILIYLTRKPKTEAGQMLKCIVRRLHKINSYPERDIWVFCFNNWCRQYNDFLKEKSKSFAGRSWYTHKLLRRTRTLIKNALADMFYYLNDSKIPKSTNGLETTFSYLKNNLKIHRGLTKQNRKNFILWYNYFKYLNLN